MLRKISEGWCGVAALGGLLLAPIAAAGDATPLALSNQAPLARIYGVPTPQPARLLAPASTQWLLTSTLANTFSKSGSADEAIFLDGESEELRLQWRRGFELGGKVLEFVAELPWVHHGGGFLDKSIVEFHDFFGMPQGNRTRFENDDLRYAYRDGDRLLLEFEQSGAALGDLQLGVGAALSQSAEHALSLRFIVKLPTGDADQLTGSGATDVSAALHFAHTLWGGDVDAAFGLVALGDGDILPQKQRDYAGFAHATYSWPWSDALDLVAQVGGNTAFYDDTDLTELKEAMYLGVGTRYRVMPSWAVEFGIIEDILVNSTPDIGFALSLRYMPADAQ